MYSMHTIYTEPFKNHLIKNHQHYKFLNSHLDLTRHRWLGVWLHSFQRIDFQRFPDEPIRVRSYRIPSGLPVQRFRRRLGIPEVR